MNQVDDDSVHINVVLSVVSKRHVFLKLFVKWMIIAFVYINYTQINIQQTNVESNKGRAPGEKHLKNEVFTLHEYTA